MTQENRDDATDLLPTASARLDLARTALFVPASRPERIVKAFATGADAVIVDLEDAVAADEKSTSRETLTQLLDDPAAFGLDAASGPTETLAIRISPPSTEAGQRDLAWLASALEDDARASRLDAIMIAKAETPRELDLVSKLLDASAPSGKTISIVPLIETPIGLVAAPVLAAHPRVSRLGLGAIDMAVQLGCEPRSATMDFVRAQLVLASALAGKGGLLDSPSAEFKDDDLVRRDTEHVKRNGCSGKLCIHPRQIPIVAEVFAPTEDELDWARRVIEVGVLGQVDGQMVDRPVTLRARQILGT